MNIVGTRLQFESLDALITYGDVKNAAYHLKISERMVQRRLHELRVQNQKSNWELAFYRGVDTREEAA